MGLTTPRLTTTVPSSAATRRVGAFVAVIAATAVALATLVQVAVPWRGPTDVVRIAMLSALLVVAELLMVRYRHGSTVNALNHFDAVLAPLLLAGPAPVVLLAVTVAQVIAAVVRRNRGIKAAFNVAQWALAGACGHLVLDALHANWHAGVARTLVVLPVAMLVVGIVNQLLFTTVVALSERQPLSRTLRAFAPVVLHGWVAGWFVNTAFGVVFALAAMTSPIAVPLMAVPLVVLHAAYRGRAVASADRVRIRAQHHASQLLTAPIDALEALPLFLRAVADLFGAAAAEIALVETERVSVTRLDATRTAHSTPTLLTHALVRRMSAHAAPVVLGAGRDAHLDGLLARAGWRDGIAAPLVVDQTVAGVISVYDRNGFEGIDGVELDALETLAREAATALWKARMVGEIVDEQRKLAEIVNHASDGILTVTADGIVASWNPELERITGYPAAEMVNRRSFARLAPRGPSGLGIALEDWTTSPAALPPELWLTARSGERRQLSCSYSPVAGADGLPRLLIVMVRDITQARAMRELQEDFRLLTEVEEAQRNVVAQLHDAVRPSIPLVPGTEVGVHYRPADEEAPTGGDLYDCQLLPDGDLHLAVVDVLGKGVAATKDAMAVTSALRMLAIEGCPLEQIMARTSALVTAQSPDLVATTLVVRYTPSTGLLRLAGAGHPPAILVPADGHARELDAPGIALGWPGASSFAVTECRLDRDDTLVLYTDGLVEATKDIIEGIAALKATASSAADYPASKLARVLVERSLAGAQHRDDSVALVLRRRSSGGGGDPSADLFEHRIPARPDLVITVRRALSDWLRVAATSADLHDDIVLVASELVTNAVRVARSSVTIRVRLDGDGVMLEVEDDGGGGLRWPGARRRAPLRESGRGLVIVEELTNDLAVFSDDDGTVVRCTRRRKAGATSPERLVQIVAQRLAPHDTSILDLRDPSPAQPRGPHPRA